MPTDKQAEILATLKSIESLLLRVVNNTSRDGSFTIISEPFAGLPSHLHPNSNQPGNR